jgi:hypothetical protein
MWDLPSKQLAYVSFYYFFIIFWTACILYDIIGNTITGFTFGYVFALFYFIFRTRKVLQLLEDLDDHKSED